MWNTISNRWKRPRLSSNIHERDVPAVPYKYVVMKWCRIFCYRIHKHKHTKFVFVVVRLFLLHFSVSIRMLHFHNFPFRANEIGVIICKRVRNKSIYGRRLFHSLARAQQIPSSIIHFLVLDAPLGFEVVRGHFCRLSKAPLHDKIKSPTPFAVGTTKATATTTIQTYLSKCMVFAVV